MGEIVAGYIDQASEKMVTAYTRERENWLRNRSAARAARIRELLSGERADVRAVEATLGYRLRQYHVGVVCWTGDAAGTADEITRLERAIGRVAAQRPAPAIRCSCPGTKRARGPGCRSGSATSSTRHRPAQPARTVTSISPSAASPGTWRVSALPTSRPSRPRR
jgi:hypothetical protein